jgi:hypothetical protein
MRPDKVIAPENCPESRLLPKRHGATLIWRTPVCFPDDPNHVVAKVNRFNSVGRSIKQSVHIFAPGFKPSKNRKALLSTKLNEARLDGEPHNPPGLLSAAGVVNARNELPKRQGFLPAIGFHGRNIGRETAPRYGVFTPFWISTCLRRISEPQLPD